MMRQIEAAEFTIILAETGELLSSCEGPMPQALYEALTYYENYAETGEEVILEYVERTQFSKNDVEKLIQACSEGAELLVFEEDGNGGC